jgi:hypothetical protein
MNAFPGFEYHMFYVLYPFITYILTLPLIRENKKLLTQIQEFNIIR